MLQSNNFPESFKPYVKQIRLLYKPIPFGPQTAAKQKQISLDHHLFKQLVNWLNVMFPLVNGKWVASDQWRKSQTHDAPVNSRICVSPQMKQGDVVYLNMKKNNSNSLIKLKTGLTTNYGMIKNIFSHSRTVPGQPTVTNPWLAIHPLTPVPNKQNPLFQLKNYEAINVALRRLDSSQEHVIHVDEVLAQCAWITYKPEELGTDLPFETMAVICLDR
ncbi:hypothetical protein PCASD_19920 [Puccinia coronata f. sp. avenae]|uniref:Uncharacterized protein n=1 Tax=Puccinia coronata f. sp. avenae TaxID=200324 RepID=A0A2N5U7T8_9BASI|nr:hypothetical protein PCASD_19920 [Puccinia coronata f. sp. avenae]